MRIQYSEDIVYDTDLCLLAVEPIYISFQSFFNL